MTAGRRTTSRRTAVIVALAAAVSLSGLAPAPRAEAAGTRYLDEVFGSWTTTKDLVYGQSATRQGVLQPLRLDVLEPAGDTATTRAAVVWVHGGYFLEGSKDVSWYTTVLEQFVKAGYVVFSIDYRLNPDLPRGLLPTLTEGQVEQYKATVRDAQHDAQAAVRWVRAHAAEYRIDLGKIAIAGHSAGGITAQSVLFNEHDPGSSGTPGVSSHVDAAISSAGASAEGVTVQIDPGESPLLISHGLVDDVVPYAPNPATCALTVALGNVCEQVLDPDQAHPQFGFGHWRSFLYRRMIAPSGELPVRLEVVGWESLLG
jgi:acetyl esterase/lipase